MKLFFVRDRKREKDKVCGGFCLVFPCLEIADEHFSFPHSSRTARFRYWRAGRGSYLLARGTSSASRTTAPPVGTTDGIARTVGAPTKVAATGSFSHRFSLKLAWVSLRDPATERNRN